MKKINVDASAQHKKASSLTNEAAETSIDFEHLFRSSPNPYLVLKPDTPKFTIVAVNDSYLTATGTVREAIIGRGLFDVFPDNPADPHATGVHDLRTSLQQVIESRKPDVLGIQKYDIPRRGPGESGFEVKYWSPVNMPVMDDQGTIEFIIHRVEDVTEFILLREHSSQEMARIEKVQARADQMEAEVLKSSREVKEANRRLKAVNDALERRERELASLNERLKELDRVKTEFFSNISHEFRTPLTLILGPVEDALHDPNTIPENRQRLDTAYRNILRLMKLVNNLLDFSRLEADRIQAVYQPTDLSALTIALASMFQSAIEKAGLKLIVDCISLNEPVYVDPDMWEKMVLNLLSNAFKHTFEGEIRVRLRRISDHVELTVEDTGVGIPADQLPHLFERFYRVPHAHSRTHEGSGIGLALVYELVKLHGGSIHVDSVVNRGSTFTVSIPIGKSHLPGDQIRGASERDTTALDAKPFVEEALGWLPDEMRTATDAEGETAWIKAADGTKVKVLLAEDNADMRAYVRRLLEPYCDVETVADGEAALKVAHQARPDLILSDIMMPKMDGFALLSAIRQDPSLKTVPIVLLSARAGEEASVEGLRAGADDYLTKPFRARELLARVKANLNLELHRVRQEAEEAKRKSEERFKSLFNQAAAGIAETDLNGKFLLVNQRYCEMVGRTREELSQLRMQDITPPEDLETNLPLFTRAVQEGTPFAIEKRYFRPDGSHVWVRNHVSLVRDHQGNPQSILAVSQDITEQKQMQEELVHAKEVAEAANQKKSQFLSNMSHELRTPLNSIIGYSEMLEKGLGGPLSDKQIKYVHSVVASGKHLLDLVNEVLDVTKIDAGKLSLHYEQIALASLIKELEEAAQALAAKKNLHVTFKIQPGLQTLETDPQRFRQILLNLLSNAIKFNKESGKVDVCLSQSQEDGWVIVEVKDTGVGIPKDKIPELFSAFYQIDTSASRSYEGTGLGLVLTKRLVELLGGNISVESEEGVGSTFTVQLPMSQAACKP